MIIDFVKKKKILYTSLHHLDSTPDPPTKAFWKKSSTRDAKA